MFNASNLFKFQNKSTQISSWDSSNIQVIAIAKICFSNSNKLIYVHTLLQSKLKATEFSSIE